jgi:hypothetical protein
MNALSSNMRTWLLWVLPFAALGLLIGWQTDWGRAWKRTVPAEPVAAPQPVAVVVLPEYRPRATPDPPRDSVERAPRTPPRRPAPPAVAETAKPRLQRGQFALSGTLMVDGKATAYLRETAGGKSRRVAKGDTVNGMVVSEIATDRVRLTLGDESEDLVLKVATGPRTTIQPAVAAAPVPGSAGAMGGPNAPGAPPGARPPTPQDVASILAERRRVARDAEAAAARNAGQTQATPRAAAVDPAAVPPGAAAPGAAVDPQWNSVYQRYQQPRR